MYIDFTIYSDSYDFKRIKKIFPESSLLLKGEKLKSGKIMPYNELSINFEQNTFIYVDDLISAFSESIGDNISTISEEIINNHLESTFCIVIKEKEEEFAISISNKNLKFLYDLNTNIDIDFI